MKNSIAILFLLLCALATGEAREVTAHESGDAFADDIALPEKQEEAFQKMGLTDPEMIRYARYLLQRYNIAESHGIRTAVRGLMNDDDPASRRALADVLDTRRGVVSIYIMRALPQAGEEIHYFLDKIDKVWARLYPKDLATLAYTLPQIIAEREGDEQLRERAEKIVSRMILDKSHKVALAGISLTKRMELDSEDIRSALRKQTANEYYEFVENVHPVKKAALEALGESYSPQQRDKIDFSTYSIAGKHDLKKSSGFTVGLICELYTAKGPCAGGGDGYGWGGMLEMLRALSEKKVNLVCYLHPITQLDNTPLQARLKKHGLNELVLNSACPKDLAMCDVLILDGLWNVTEELIDALEEYVWNGGGIVIVEAMGGITCKDQAQFAVLQDRSDINWAWSKVKDEGLMEERENPLTAGVDLSFSLKQPGRSFHKHPYVIRGLVHKPQILLRFKNGKESALRVGAYGTGRVANFGWDSDFADDEYGRRDWEIFERTLQWAGNRKYRDFRVQPAFSTSRYYKKRKPGSDAELDQMYEKAYYLEVAKGSKDEAIALYKRIADKPPDDNTVSAVKRALIRLCVLNLEQGNVEEADRLYKRLILDVGANPQEAEVDVFYSGVDEKLMAYLIRSNRMFAGMGLYVPETVVHNYSEEDLREVEKEWLETLNGSMSKEQASAIEALGAIHSTKAVAGLLRIATNPEVVDNRRRWAAVRALGRIGDKNVVPELIHLVDYYNENTRYWARASLSRLTGQYFDDDKEAWGEWWNAQGGRPAYVAGKKYPTLEEATKNQQEGTARTFGLDKLNLDFERGPLSSAYASPACWGGGGQGYEIVADNKEVHQGKWSCRIKQIGKGGFGTVTGTLNKDTLRILAGKKIRYSGYMKMQNVERMAGLWFRADVNNQPAAFDNMAGRKLKGSKDWTYYSLELDIPDDVDNINFGALVSGKGTVWVDDVSIEIVR